ncbi:MAG: DDE-type integrase/transposase/recombinase [Saprospiraceae bacterium]|nr:DDE-type integrase/transposase/recombinase [Saprospiraceae bacterium]
MNELYNCLGKSKQSVHQYLARKVNIEILVYQIRIIVQQVRKDHPMMGVRDIYYKMRPKEIGRDRFEDICKIEGLLVQRARNYRRTTNSLGVTRFENLTIDLKLSRINQLWQSDITYFEIKGRFYYITFIIDSYSRKIVGHSTAKKLKYRINNITSIVICQKKDRKITSEDELILHSDGGGQYSDKEVLRITKAVEIQNSMCEYAVENSKAERINGVIKNNSLKHRSINTYEELVKEVEPKCVLI